MLTMQTSNSRMISELKNKGDTAAEGFFVIKRNFNRKITFTEVC